MFNHILVGLTLGSTIRRMEDENLKGGKFKIEDNLDLTNFSLTKGDFSLKLYFTKLVSAQLNLELCSLDKI